ncbi:MAG: glutathione transport system substrate-binding protein [Actinomycetota bacterium]|nr:glutathione transport system substrate-binding protein [Actinomycetota bacterium]
MRMHRRGALLALPLTAALAVSACGGSSSGGNAAPKPKTNNGVAAISINAHPDSDLKDGGTIIWSMDQFGPQWNVNQVNGNETSMVNAMDAVMPVGLVSDEKANLSFNADFFTAKVTSQSPQTIEYTINSKAKWSNGQPITAADFVAQWKALNGSNPKFDPPSTSGYDQIQDVHQGSGPTDVITVYKKTYAEWQGLFSPLYPASTNSTPSHFDKDYNNAVPVTAGPFKFGSFDKSAQTLTVVRDDSFWGKKPHLDRIVFKTLESTAGDQAFANGEIDYDYSITPNSAEYKLAAGNPNGKVLVAAGPDQRQFTFHNGGVLADVNVRKAIAMGINRAAIAKADLTGLPVGTPATLDNHIFVNTQAGYTNEAGDVGKYDATAANKALDDAGWAKGADGVRAKAGKQLKVRFTIPAGVASSKNEGELVQAMMSAIGVKLVITTVPSNDFFDKYIIPGNFDITPFSWIGTPFPAGGSRDIYICKKGSSGGSNFTAMCDPAIDQDFTDALSSLDLNVYRQKLNDADQHIWSEVHSLMLYQRPQMNGVKNGIANLGSFGFASVDYSKIGYLK